MLKNNRFLKKALIITGIGLGVILCVFAVFKLAFYFAPFIIAFVVAWISEPLIKLLNKKLRIPRRIATIITLLIDLATIGSLLTVLIMKISNEIKNIYNNIDYYYNIIYTNLSAFINKIPDIYIQLPENIVQNIQNMIGNLTSSVTDILKSVFKGILNTAISIPDALIFVIITILASYFMSSDRQKIADSINRHIPDSWIKKITNIKNDMFSALFGYIKAQLILMSITFVELSIGFLILGINHAVILAFFTSFIDAFPILGTGGILIPWAAYSFLTGNITLGVSLLIIYGIVLSVRQLIEPKILGTQIGIHPLITLISMYIGLRILGFAGLLAGPITVLLLKNIYTSLLKNTSFLRYIEKPLNSNQSK